MFEDNRKVHGELVSSFRSGSDESLGSPVPFGQTVKMYQEALRSPRRFRSDSRGNGVFHLMTGKMEVAVERAKRPVEDERFKLQKLASSPALLSPRQSR